jgi:hypothetical protein
MDIEPRSHCLPHFSYVARNLTTGPVIFRLVPAKEGKSFSWYRPSKNHPDLFSRKYKVLFTGQHTAEHIIEPGEAVTVIIKGSLKAPKHFKKPLLLAVEKPEYQLSVTELNVVIAFEYKGKTRDWAETFVRFPTKYTEQEIACKFVFHVTYTRNKIEEKRCCLVHLPQWHQNKFLYFPHKWVQFSTKCRSCDCCQ